MRIKKLELVGFKSFKDRTVISFDQGITGIVGPNGCGKSNIVDALVWVMGEMSAKHLRGSTMGDVIFAGAEGFAPMGMAEVSLTLENDGGPFPVKYGRHTEIMITRRLHKSGESEYLINKEPSRLRDVQEIFMDTGAGSKGFSIVEQGKIGEIITAKPENRRVLIEEAAGITKFKARKKESQRKLVSTEQNLIRLQDIIGEQKRQLNSLERQAQRAERYRKLKNEVQDKELWLSSQKYLGLSDERKAVQSELETARTSETGARTEVSELGAKIQAIKLELAEKENLLAGRQRVHGELQEVVSVQEKEIREFEFEIEQARRDKEMAGTVIDKYTVQKSVLEQDQAGLSNKAREIEVRAGQLSEQYELENQAYQSIMEDIQALDTALEDHRKELTLVSVSESQWAANKSSIRARFEEKESQRVDAASLLEELGTQFTAIEVKRKKASNSLESQRQRQLEVVRDTEVIETNLGLAKTDFRTRQTERDNLRDDLNKVTSRLYGLENLQDNFEGFQEGVKNIMFWQRKKMESTESLGGGSTSAHSYQPIAEVVEVPEAYELAMEAALGSRLQLLLSDTAETSLRALDFLKEHNHGRSSFLSEDLCKKLAADGSEKSVKNLTDETGVDDFLINRVQIPEGHRGAVAYFLSDIVVVDSVRTALRLRPLYPGRSFVTQEGDLLSEDGVLTGGSKGSADSGVIKRRREIKELAFRKDELTGKLGLLQAVMDRVESQVAGLEADLELSRQGRNEQEILVAELKKDLEIAQTEFNNGQKAIGKQTEEVSALDAQLLTEQERLTEAEVSLKEASERKAILEAKVMEDSATLLKRREGVEDQQKKVTELRVESAARRQEAEGLKLQLDMLEASLREVNVYLNEMSTKSDTSFESLNQNQVKLEKGRMTFQGKVREAEEAARLLASGQDEYEAQLTNCRELENHLNQRQQSAGEFKSKIIEAELKFDQLEMKEQHLLEQIQEKYILDLSQEAEKYRDIAGDQDELEKEVTDLRGRLQKIGEVNLSAIEEYDELTTRYEFLSKQYEDLQSAKAQLKKVIDRINRICTHRFKETLAQVNDRFVKVFPVLFGGGEARLDMIEDPEKGEIGIDIIAKPPGKKLQNVSLLSGGEKALTAVSLIFSIFLVKPSPFCLLDEVDAPLDDANIYRFNDLVREMAKRSQMIVVTHNKHTMKVNDRLYGVTMQQKGISKMVTVSLEDAQKHVEVAG